jgi:hypothetical protein
MLASRAYEEWATDMNEEPTNEPVADPTFDSGGQGNVVDLHLKRFDIVCRYLQYENTVYWTRSQLFLVANAALLGFLANRLPEDTKASWVRMIVVLVLLLLGLGLSILWLLILRAAHGWIEHWHSHLKHLEPMAFPNGALKSPLFADVDRLEAHWPIKRLSLVIVYAFIGVWFLAVIFAIGLAVLKACAERIL